MPFKRLSLLVGLCAVALVLPSAAGAEGTPIPGQYIVVLKVGATGRAQWLQHRALAARASADAVLRWLEHSS